MASSNISELINLSSLYRYRLFRDGVCVWEHEEPNLVTNEGLDYAMSLIFGEEKSTSPTFYVGLVGAGGATPNKEDTMSSHGFNENTNYTKAERSVTEWQKTDVATYFSNASQFFMSKDTWIEGAFLTTGLQKGGSEGYLYGVSKIPVRQNVKQGDALFVEIRVKATG